MSNSGILKNYISRTYDEQGTLQRKLEQVINSNGTMSESDCRTEDGIVVECRNRDYSSNLPNRTVTLDSTENMARTALHEKGVNPPQNAEISFIPDQNDMVKVVLSTSKTEYYDLKTGKLFRVIQYTRDNQQRVTREIDERFKNGVKNAKFTRDFEYTTNGTQRPTQVVTELYDDNGTQFLTSTETFVQGIRTRWAYNEYNNNGKIARSMIETNRADGTLSSTEERQYDNQEIIIQMDQIRIK